MSAPVFAILAAGFVAAFGAYLTQRILRHATRELATQRLSEAFDWWADRIIAFMFNIQLIGARAKRT